MKNILLKKLKEQKEDLGKIIKKLESTANFIGQKENSVEEFALRLKRKGWVFWDTDVCDGRCYRTFQFIAPGETEPVYWEGRTTAINKAGLFKFILALDESEREFVNSYVKDSLEKLNLKDPFKQDLNKFYSYNWYGVYEFISRVEKIIIPPQGNIFVSGREQFNGRTVESHTDVSNKDKLALSHLEHEIELLRKSMKDIENNIALIEDEDNPNTLVFVALKLHQNGWRIWDGENDYSDKRDPQRIIVVGKTDDPFNRQDPYRCEFGHNPCIKNKGVLDEGVFSDDENKMFELVDLDTIYLSDVFDIIGEKEFLE